MKTARIAAGIAALAIAHAATAQPSVAVDSAVFVERSDPESGRVLEPGQQFSRGDRLVYVMRWERTGGNGGFTLTNPLPRTVYYQGSAHEGEEVSVDGGRTWGALGNLQLRGRLATPEDVTHVRWHIAPPQAARGNGRIAYSAVVR
jgi:hypothetical protein